MVSSETWFANASCPSTSWTLIPSSARRLPQLASWRYARVACSILLSILVFFKIKRIVLLVQCEARYILDISFPSLCKFCYSNPNCRFCQNNTARPFLLDNLWWYLNNLRFFFATFQNVDGPGWKQCFCTCIWDFECSLPLYKEIVVQAPKWVIFQM